MTSSTVTSDALGVSVRLLSGLTDSAMSTALGRPARLRFGLSTRGVLAARTDRITITIADVNLAGLDVASARIDAHRVSLHPGWPPHLRAGPVEVRITLTQAALDRWMLADTLPVRLRLRDTGLSLQAGAVGVRLAEVGADLEVTSGRLVVTPNRAQVLGVSIPTSGMRVPLPLPPLPRGTRLTSVVVVEGAATIALSVSEVDEPLAPAQAAKLGRLLRPRA